LAINLLGWLTIYLFWIKRDSNGGGATALSRGRAKIQQNFMRDRIPVPQPQKQPQGL